MDPPARSNRSTLQWVGAVLACVYALAALFIGSFVIWAWVADRLFG